MTLKLRLGKEHDLHPVVGGIFEGFAHDWLGLWRGVRRIRQALEAGALWAHSSSSRVHPPRSAGASYIDERKVR